MKQPGKSEWIFVFGHPIHRTEFYKLLFFGLSTVVLLCGLVLYFCWGLLFPAPARASAVVAAESAVATEVITEFSKTELDLLFAQHRAATRYEEVKSIRAVGSYTSGEVEMEFTLFAKFPHFYKQSLKFVEGGLVEVGYDGTELWYHQTVAVLDESDAALMALNRSLVILEGSIPALVWASGSAGGSTVEFELMPDAEWNGRECRVVRQIGLLEVPVYHYIDTITGMEVYRRCTLAIDGRPPRQVELMYAAPLEGADYPIPAGFELWMDGVLYCTARFDQIDVNVGLPNFMFQERQ